MWHVHTEKNIKSIEINSHRVRVRVRVRVKLLRLFRVNNYGWRAAMEQLANLI